MSALLRIASTTLSLLGVATIVAACSNTVSESIDTSESAIKTCPAGYDLECTDGCGPPDCLKFIPPVCTCVPLPPPPPTPCPAGDTCSAASTHLAAPVAGCQPPVFVTETGATPTSFMASYCTSNATVSAWVAGQPASWNARLAGAVPCLTPPAAGMTYVTFMPPAPTAMPISPTCGTNDSCLTAQHEVWTDPSGNALPCTQIYLVPSNRLNGTWEAYCVDTPAVDAWSASFTCLGQPSTCNGGETLTPPDGAPAAPYGYVYLSWWSSTHIVIIGGGCASSCHGL